MWNGKNANHVHEQNNRTIRVVVLNLLCFGRCCASTPELPPSPRGTPSTRKDACSPQTCPSCAPSLCLMSRKVIHTVEDNCEGAGRPDAHDLFGVHVRLQIYQGMTRIETVLVDDSAFMLHEICRIAQCESKASRARQVAWAPRKVPHFK